MASIHRDSVRRGFSLVGLLVTMTCMVVLSVLLMTSMNRRMTGEGSAVDGTVRSYKDQFVLHALHQSMTLGADDFRDQFITPRALTGSDDRALDTTANLFSAMVMYQYLPVEQLIAANEYSGYVLADDDYDFNAYDDLGQTFWDPSFQADLHDLSNTSFAHVPLFGKRFHRAWQISVGRAIPVLGNRGPRDGEPDPRSFAVGRSGVWGGHVVYPDGHIEFLTTFIPPGAWLEREGGREPDNIFRMDDPPDGPDAVLAFTTKMSDAGPTLQWDPSE